MKTIQLDGKYYTLDEVAYAHLTVVLNRQIDRNTAERTIAAEFDMLLTAHKTTISASDLVMILRKLNYPDNDTQYNKNQVYTKKLTRTNRSNCKIAGVCGGLAKYFGIEDTLVRVAFLLIVFLGGSGILLYLILWLVMPEEPFV